MINSKENQIAYANEITKEWRKAITGEIERVALRADSTLGWYASKLDAALVKFDQAIAQVGAVKVILMKNAGINPAKAMIKQAQQK